MIFDMETCGGCRTCELACSFHHKGEFIPEASSIKILDNKKGAGFIVLFVEKSDGSSIPCDGCKSIKRPLCVQYCKDYKKLEEMINKLMEEKLKVK